MFVMAFILIMPSVCAPLGAFISEPFLTCTSPGMVEGCVGCVTAELVVRRWLSLVVLVCNVSGDLRSDLKLGT